VNARRPLGGFGGKTGLDLFVVPAVGLSELLGLAFVHPAERLALRRIPALLKTANRRPHFDQEGLALRYALGLELVFEQEFRLLDLLHAPDYCGIRRERTGSCRGEGLTQLAEDHVVFRTDHDTAARAALGDQAAADVPRVLRVRSARPTAEPSSHTPR
jgi:hypothetical protein